MKLLVLGGTRFLGRHVVELATLRGHDVTMFNRGQTNPELFPSVEALHGDRDGDLAALVGRQWDAVIDVCGYVPRVVAQSVAILREHVPHYTFISSISVYPNFPELGMDESYPVDVLPDDALDSEDIGKYYGALKALCEKEVEEAYGVNALIVRPGLIVGPHDPTDRFTYWPHRFSDGGSVLVPGERTRTIQFIDARDLALWTLDMVERKQSGVYNATGPLHHFTMENLVDVCTDVVREDGTSAQAVWVDEAFLKEHQVGAWVELPLWIPEEANWPGFGDVSIEKAKANGLTCRSVEETVRDTLAWSKSRSEFQWKAGLSRERETELLKAWAERT